MGSIDYFRSALKGMHKSYLEAIEDLDDEQFHFKPLDKGNHIAFILWHLVRTEDTVINFFLQKKNTVWNEEGWDEKLGMDPRAQGTGMTAEQSAEIKIKNLGDFSAYMTNVFKSTEGYLEELRDEDLDVVHDLPMMGKRSLYEVIGGTGLQHASSHLGEIYYVRGLLGLKGGPV